VAAGSLEGAAALLAGGGGSAREDSRDRYTVARGSFEITVPASGELAARKQEEIRNRLEYRAAITEIVAEGTFANQGDVLLRFATDEIDNKIKDAEDEVNTANSALIAAQANLDIKLSERESEIAQADLKVTLAQLALKAWEEGEVVTKRQQLKLETETAGMDYQRLFDKFEESKKLAGQQFISKDELRSDEIRMVEAKARLEQAKLDAQVYEEYEYRKEEAQKNSDVEQAVAERQRVAERHKAALETARTEVASKEYQLRSRQERLTDLRQQLEYCIVKAPSSGLVVYPTSMEEHRWSRGDRGDLQVGAEVSRNELLMLLPDTTEMTAEVKVNESLTGLIKAGQRVSVAPDALPDVSLEGEVTQIGVLAESGGWRDPNRRDYTVKVLLSGTQGLGLKPSMRCKGDIYVGQVDDAIHVPLQAVFREGPDAFVYVPQGQGFTKRHVALGQASSLNIQITDGLGEGDVVLLRQPKPREVIARGNDQNQKPGGEGQAALGRSNRS
jgi:HlyD family secretion protein